MDLRFRTDMPLVEGDLRDSKKSRKQIISLLKKWKKSKISGFSQISAITKYHRDGLKAIITYPIFKDRKTSRTGLLISQDLDALHDEAFINLREVLSYLVDQSIAAKQIELSGNKKIFVKRRQNS